MAEMNRIMAEQKRQQAEQQRCKNYRTNKKISNSKGNNRLPTMPGFAKIGAKPAVGKIIQPDDNDLDLVRPLGRDQSDVRVFKALVNTVNYDGGNNMNGMRSPAPFMKN